MYQYRGEGLSSQRLHQPSRPPLSVPESIHSHHQNLAYLPPSGPSLQQPHQAQQPPPPPTAATSAQHQIPRMPHRQSESSQTMTPTGPGPAPYSTTHDGKIWSLVVVQQPVRARMCGFGDKDRRPITPPPCILLEVLDMNTRQHVNVHDLETSCFVLTVDLWDASGTEEQNLVKNPANSPSIGNADAMSYPAYTDGPVQPSSSSSYYPSSQNGYPSDPRYPPPRHAPHYAGAGPYNGPPPGPSSYGPPPPNGYQYHQAYPPPSPYHTSPMTPGGPYSHMVPPNMHSHDMMAAPPSANPPQYNRNLIGSLSASAFKLTDTRGNMGIWFIMQDLSVRQEGIFRLKMSFVDVGDPSSRDNKSSALAVSPDLSAANGGPSNGLKKAAPVLASCFSEPFQVFSAKRFPGVIESTQLSKCFASQGIKIPIRQNDAGNKRGRDGDSSDEEENGISPGGSP